MACGDELITGSSVAICGKLWFMANMSEQPVDYEPNDASLPVHGI